MANNAVRLRKKAVALRLENREAAAFFEVHDALSYGRKVNLRGARIALRFLEASEVHDALSCGRKALLMRSKNRAAILGSVGSSRRFVIGDCF